jgi:hypothetical protein
MRASRLLVALPFAPSPARGRLASLAVLLLYAAIYLKDWASAFAGSAVAGAVLGAGMLVGALAFTLEQRAGLAHLQPGPTKLLLVTALCFLVTTALKGEPPISSYYVAVPCAWVVLHTRPHFFFRLMLLHLGLTLAIQAGEYLSGQYLFIYETHDGTALDERLFGGGLEVFRAKGMFQGPLSAVAFALWMCFIMRGSLAAALSLFLVAFFASGRLGMLTSGVVFALRLIVQRGHQHNASGLWRVGVLVLTALMAAGLLAFADEDRLFFISTALDLDNDQNVSRVYFWLTALHHYLSYSPLDMMLGNYGLIFAQQGGTENDLLRLLLDCGAVGLLLYALPWVLSLVRSARGRDLEGVAVLLLVMTLMNVFPFIQSLSSAVLFWLFLWSRQAGAVMTNRTTPNGVLPLAGTKQQ